MWSEDSGWILKCSWAPNPTPKTDLAMSSVIGLKMPALRTMTARQVEILLPLTLTGF
jgi:hypothetical protein